MYGAIASAAVVVPEGEALDEVHKNYSEMAIVGRVTDAQRRVFFAEGEKLCRDRGAEVVLLGGTGSVPCLPGATDCRIPGARLRRRSRRGYSMRDRSAVHRSAHQESVVVSEEPTS